MRLNYNIPIGNNKDVDIEGEKVDIEFIEACLSNIILNLPTKEKIKIVC